MNNRSYTGIPKKAYTADNMETTMNILEIPVITEEFEEETGEDEDFEDIPTKKTIICQCESCKRNIEIKIDEDDNIIGASCPDCHPHIKAS